MRPAAIRIINKYRNRLGLRPLAPNERDGVALSVLLDELAVTKTEAEAIPASRGVSQNCPGLWSMQITTVHVNGEFVEAPHAVAMRKAFAS
jgi:hypothetical protein